MNTFINILSGIGGALIGMFCMSATSWMYDQDWPTWVRVLSIAAFVFLLLTLLDYVLTPTQVLWFKVSLFVFLIVSFIIGLIIEGDER